MDTNSYTIYFIQLHDQFPNQTRYTENCHV